MNNLTRLKRFIESRFSDKGANCINITSFPKAGRTWLKVILSQYLSLKYDVSEENDLPIESFHTNHPEVPHIKFLHDDTPFWKKPSELKTSKKDFRSSKVILLVRDPRDIIVSGYFQKSKRHTLKPEATRITENKPVYIGTLKEYVYEEVGGIDSLIEFYNIWWDQQSQPKEFKLVKYESLREDIFKEALSILNFIGLKDVDTQQLNKAIEYASFDNLKELEKRSTLKLRYLTPADIDDPESFKVRRGKVGGYVDYLEQPEIDYLNEQIRKKLHPAFGYA